MAASKVFRWGTALLFLGWAAQVAAEPLLPRGTEIPVNGPQTGVQQAPKVAISATGSFVVVWQGPEGGGNGLGIFARTFGPDGKPLGPGEIHVNTVTAGDQTQPAVGMNTTGNFMVVWEGPVGETEERGIHARRFLATGAAHTSEFVVSLSPGIFSSPDTTLNEDWDSLIVWRHESGSHDGDAGGIYGRIVGTQGGVTGEIRINTSTAGDQADPAVAGIEFPEPAFFVVWEGPDGAGNETGIFMQQVGRDGHLVGPEVAVNSGSPAGAQVNPAVAASSLDEFHALGAQLGVQNRVVVVWEGPDPATSPVRQRIWSRSFDNFGQAIAAELVIDSDADDPDQHDPAVSMGSSDSFGFIPFVATWTETTPVVAGLGGSPRVVGAERPEVDSLLGGGANREFVLSSPSWAAQASDLAVQPNGDFVGVWESDRGQPNEWEVVGQLFERSLFTDGFESGGTGEWSSAFP